MSIASCFDQSSADFLRSEYCDGADVAGQIVSSLRAVKEHMLGRSCISCIND